MKRVMCNIPVRSRYGLNMFVIYILGAFRVRPVRIFTSLSVLFISLATFLDIVAAQNAAIDMDKPTLEAAPRTGDITIDGHLDEAAWLAAYPTKHFIQREPIEGAKPGQVTEVRVLYDDRALYIGARMYDDSPKDIAKQLVRRDESGQFDFFTVSIDPNNDKRTGYQFRISASGVQRDAYLYNDVKRDTAWNAVWASRVSIDKQGWVAEMRIPLSQIRYEVKDEQQSWGINFRRRRLATNETMDFALQSRVRYGRVSVFGRLEGLHLPTEGSRIELRPYVLGSARTEKAEQDNPFFDGSELNTRMGLDLRYGLGSSYTLDMAFNPDFGQVEVDPAVVNLSEFETFFQERRPFFVEDAQVFDFNLSGRDELIYSRRIGRQPRGRTPDGSAYSDVPTETTILGAAKITGRSVGGTSIGAMAALTGHEKGRASSSSDGQILEFSAEPRTKFGVFRIRRDFRNGATQVGAVSTLLHRDLPKDGSFDFLTSSALTTGVDFEHNWGGGRNRDWAIYGYLSGSRVHGKSEALLRLQQSSNHYFQRPDATRFAVDSTATSMSGYNWRFSLAKRDSKNWSGSIWFAEISPGFEINDLGFSRSNERIDGGARVEYRNITPGRFFREYSFRAFTFYNFRHEALDDPWAWDSWRQAYKSGVFYTSADFELDNYWEIGLDTRYSPTRFSDTLTRGGPIMESPGSYSFGLDIGSDRRGRASIRSDLEYEKVQHGGYRWSTSIDASIRPTSNFELEISPNIHWGQNPSQYVTQTDVIPFEPTLGSRYLFSDLKRQSFSLETRLNVTFSPYLTLQLYAQPLLSSGNYLNYKQLLRSKSFAFDILSLGEQYFIDPADGQRHLDFDGDGTSDIGLSDPNFNIQSLRMNVVLRWEYRPGSRVFFVWQQNRKKQDQTGSIKLGRDLGNLFGAESENIFIIKFNYWFGV